MRLMRAEGESFASTFGGRGNTSISGARRTPGVAVAFPLYFLRFEDTWRVRSQKNSPHKSWRILSRAFVAGEIHQKKVKNSLFMRVQTSDVSEHHFQFSQEHHTVHGGTGANPV